MTARIQLQQVTRCFGDLAAVRQLDLEVQPGEVLGLLGHNGAGKTTTIRLVAGLLAPSGGRIRVDGLDPTVDGPAVRRRLGVLPANAAVDDRLSGRANLRFAADLHQLPTDGLEKRIASLLERFGLTHRADDPAGTYSTGMRQRLSFARVLLHDPGILLLDEPTASLDPVAARDVRDAIAELAQDHRAIILCTHDMAEAERLSDRIVIIEHGRVLAEGSPAALAERGATSSLVIRMHPDDTATAAAITGVEESASRGELRSPSIAPDSVPRLLQALLDGDVRVHEVVRASPSLEDVYLSLHETEPQKETA